MSQSQESSASPFLLWVGNPIPAASLPALLGCRLDLAWSTAQLSSAKALILAQGGCRAQGISLQYEVGESRSLSRDPSVVRAWSCCLCLLWAGAAMSHSASSAACCHQRQTLVLWHSSRHGTAAARLEEWSQGWAVPEWGQCTGHLLLKTELYQLCAAPRRVIRSLEDTSVSLGQKPVQQWGLEVWRCLL